MGNQMSIIRSFSVGEGDMFFIKHDNDNFTIIDCCMSEENRDFLVKELKSQSKDKNIVRFISTHPDDDHILGLSFLHEKMNNRNFYCVKNQARKADPTADFEQYCALRDDASKVFYLYRGCARKWINQGDEARGSSGIHILWPLVTNEYYKEALTQTNQGKSPNNISPILTYTLKDGATVMWMGDLEDDFMENIKDAITMESADILFAPHHGRDSGKVPQEWLETINPAIIIIGEAQSKDLNYYDEYNTITQNSTGDIILQCEQEKTHIWVSNWRYSVDYLHNEHLSDGNWNYLGTLYV
jgi:beta-lactamase superfamily II metal-dependent hydrolase